MEKDPEAGTPQIGLGYGVCFEHHEINAVAMVILKRTLNSETFGNPSKN